MATERRRRAAGNGLRQRTPSVAAAPCAILRHAGTARRSCTIARQGDRPLPRAARCR